MNNKRMSFYCDSALGYLLPAPETVESIQTVSTTLQLSVLTWILTLMVVQTKVASQ